MYTKKTMEELNRRAAAEMQAGVKHPIIVILDDVRSMHNVGATFRTCDAFAVQALYLCGYTPQPPHRDIHKTALGATETVSWKHFETTVDAAHAAKNAGYLLLAIEQTHNSESLETYHIQPNRPVAFVFGNEVSGVSDEVLALADGVIEIPQWGAKHSLNISVSVGIVLWEAVRSRAAAR